MKDCTCLEWLGFMKRELEGLRARGLFRSMPVADGLPGREIGIKGEAAVNFSSNDYLGLAGHSALIEAAREYAARFGAGATASRLIAGNREPHRELEEAVARWKQTEAALLFGSGYQANVGVLYSVVGEGDLIISDELNHASIVDGCRLSRAEVRIYPHRDLDRVEDLLKLNGFGRKLVVTESIFSMDGDRAPLKELSNLCERWGAALMVDEAHAAGVLGPQGRGLAAEQGVTPLIQMGTLGKAMGAAGAYVAGPRLLVDLLVNRARSLIFTTAAPPAVIGSALAALQIVSSEEGEHRRALLAERVSQFHKMLMDDHGAAVAGHIIPFKIGDSRLTMDVSAKCLEAGVFVQGIRYPTVPEGTARLRFSLMSTHTPEDLQKAADALKTALRDIGPLARAPR